MDFQNSGQLFQYVFLTLNLPLALVGVSSVLTLLALSTQEWVAQNQVTDLATNLNPLLPIPEVYDFIVVGGGSAGAVVAYRLSESGRYKVLLLEAGGDPTPYNGIPALDLYALGLANDWNYTTVPQNRSCLSCKNQQMKWARGKCLGGSSTLNFMMYVRGHPMDYATWTQQSGDSQWTYDNCLPYFKKSENYEGYYADSEFHGFGGPLTVSTPEYYPPMRDLWLDAGNELGFDIDGLDYNSYQIPGFYPVDNTIKNGTREGTYAAFIVPARSRSNLKITSYAHVMHIDLNANNTATGVTYKRNGQIIQAKASKEVILSAGAIGTPQILMLSGIGPKTHLQSVGVTPKVDLPGVGGNLQDHVMTILGPFVVNESISIIIERNITADKILQYATTGTGVLSWNLMSGLAFINTSYANSSWPDVQAIIVPMGVNQDVPPAFQSIVGMQDGVYQNYLEPYMNMDSAFVLVNVARPKTRGTIRLNSSNPFEHPLIDPNYFADDEDIKVLVEGMKTVIKAFETTSAFQRYNATFSPLNKLATCVQFDRYSDEYLECYAKHLTMTTWHFCGTAKFENAGDPSAVLNSNLTVLGVGGLRVADASVMPNITNGNLNAPTIMIGEKVSQMILDFWNPPLPPTSQAAAPRKTGIKLRLG